LAKQAKERLILILVESGSGRKALGRLASVRPSELTTELLLAGVGHDCRRTAAIALDPKHASAYWQRSLLRARDGKKELAASDRQKAVELDPRMGFAESQFGKTMENLTGKDGKDAAIELFSKEGLSNEGR
jgi:hypothetical protein